MKELIKLSDTHYIVVKDSEIKVNDWVYKIKHSHTSEFYVNTKELADDYNRNSNDYKKIIKSTSPLPGVKLISMDEVLEMRISTLERKLVETSKKINQIYEELNSNNH
jgi:hypothetical protein